MEAAASLLCFFVILLVIQSSFCAVITSPPQSVTVLLNEKRVNFTCEGTGDVLRWLVASLPANNPLNQERDITVTDISTAAGNLSSVLIIAVLLINDGVVISCLLYSLSNLFDPVDESTSKLTIRGISPVEDIQWFSETQTLSWSRPSFYSQDVIVYALSDTNYNVLVDGTSIINTTDTSVELTSSLVNVSCTKFNASVTASANVYVSEEKQEVIDNTGNYTVSINNNSTLAFNGTSGTFNVNLTNTMNFTAQSCNNTIIGRLTPDEGIVQDKHYIITDEEHETFFYTFIGLKPCQIYKAEIDILNSFDKVECHDNTTIVTYQVQDVLVSSEGYTNGSVNVQCVFVSGSTADGCHVIFTDTTNGRNESFNITGSDNTTISLSTSGHYNVTVYDIINEDIIPWSCVKSKGVTVTSTIPTFATSTFSSDSATSLVSLASVLTPPSTVTVGTESSGGSKNDDDYIIYVIVSGSIGAFVLALFLIIPLCVIIGRRQSRKERDVLNAELAGCHQTQADNNKYEELALVRTVPVATDGAVTTGIPTPPLTPITTYDSSEPNLENPYHVTADEISAIRNAQQDHSPATTTTTIPSIEVQSNNSSGSSPCLDNHETYLTSPTPTTSGNLERVVTVSSNSAAYATVTINNNDTKAPVNPPTGVQPVMYSKVTGDITKGGEIVVYPDDNSNTTTADHCPVTIDDDENTNDFPPFPPPPPYEKQDFNSFHLNPPNTSSHPEEETSQPNTLSRCVPPALSAKPITDECHFVSVNPINTVTDGQIVHNDAQYGTESGTSYCEAPLPYSDANQ